jgi:integrase
MELTGMPLALMQHHIDIKAETQSVRPVTIDGYLKLKKYADRFIGDRLITELTFLDIEDFCRELKKHGGQGGKPVGANHVMKVYGFVKSALKKAVRNRWIAYNPASDACPFKSEKPEVSILSEDETRRFIDRVLEYFNCYSGDDTPVCANSKGGFMRPSNLSKFAKNFLLDNGFDAKVTLHSLRHGFVTHLLDRGMPANQIGQVSGQTPKVVLDTYGNHRSEAVIRRIAAELNEMTSLAAVS